MSKVSIERVLKCLEGGKGKEEEKVIDFDAEKIRRTHAGVIKTIALTAKEAMSGEISSIGIAIVRPDGCSAQRFYVGPCQDAHAMLASATILEAAIMNDLMAGCAEVSAFDDGGDEAS